MVLYTLTCPKEILRWCRWVATSFVAQWWRLSSNRLTTTSLCNGLEDSWRVDETAIYLVRFEPLAPSRASFNGTNWSYNVIKPSLTNLNSCTDVINIQLRSMLLRFTYNNYISFHYQRQNGRIYNNDCFWTVQKRFTMVSTERTFNLTEPNKVTIFAMIGFASYMQWELVLLNSLSHAFSMFVV